jgi:predicted dehydrogenase
MPPPLRVGVVGLRRGLPLLRVFQHHADAVVTAVCDRDAARAAAVAAEHRVPLAVTEVAALLDSGPDVVVVATPPACHLSHSTAALRAGAHVLCEVPAVAALEEAPVLAEAVRAARGLYMLAENCCYWAFVEGWEQLLRAGALGDPLYAEAEYVHDCRGLLREEDGTPTWRAALHPIEYCTHSLGPLLRLLQTHCTRATALSTGSRLSPELGTHDLQVALLETAAGVPLKLLCAFGTVRRPAFHHYLLYGTRGFLERPRGEDVTLAFSEQLPGLSTAARLPLGVQHPHAPPWAAVGGHGSAEWAMVNAFVAAIRAGGPSPLGLEPALAMTLPGLCARRSLEQRGAPVAIPHYA